jgi:hypothetical protein
MFWLVVFGLAPAACSRRPDVVSAETENLSKIRGAYEAASAQLHRPPRGMEELTPHLRKVGAPDELLRSRTGEPFRIVWKTDPRGFSRKANYPNIIAYESTGVNGQHYVVTSMGVAPLTDEELARILAAQNP